MLALVALMTVYFRPAVVLLVFLLPVLPIQFSSAIGQGLPLVTASRLLLMAGLLAGLLNVALGRLSVRSSGIELGIAVWLLACLASLPASIDATTSRLRLISELTEYVGLFYLVFLAFDRRTYQIPLVALVLAGAVNAALGMADSLFGFNPLRDLPGGREQLVSVGDIRLGLARAQGTFQHPVFLAVSLAMVVPVAYALYVTGHRALRGIGLPILALLTAGLLLTLTRSAWLAAAGATLLVFVWLVRRYPRYWWHAYWVALAIAVAAVFFPVKVGHLGGFMSDLTVTQSTRSSATTGYRLLLAKQVAEKAGDRPVTGYGLGTFGSVGITGVYEGRVMSLSSPDNHFLRVIIETGYLGLAAFLAMLSVIAYRGLQTVARTPVFGDRLLAVSILGSLVAFVLINVSVSAYSIAQTGFVFWILTALLLRLRVDPPSR
jgi:O-antigen ligase